MSTKKPLVSVLMAVYNGEKFQREAIESILNQTYANFEFLIINDGSTDLTEDIILSYSDSRIRYIKNETNLKLIASLNKGLDLAKGKYIARMDADDISLPERLEKQVDFMERNQEYILIGTRVLSFGKNNNLSSPCLEHVDILKTLHFSNCIYHSSVMINKYLMGGLKYDNQYLHVEDYELWTRLISMGKMKIIDNILLKYRVHDDSICQSNHLFQYEMVKKVRKKILSQYGLNIEIFTLDIYNKLINNATNNYFKDLEPIAEYSKAELVDLTRIITALKKSKTKSSNIDNHEYIYHLRAFMFAEFVDANKLKGGLRFLYLTSNLFSLKQFSKKLVLKWIIKN
jgi:glycosyltransferase involved in cell wall biosynthesis